MKALLTRFATPLIVGLFVVSMISGVALFFHWLPPVFHSMHVWLSMLLLVPFVLHLWRNWSGLLNYVRRKTLWVPLTASLVVAGAFGAAGMTGGRGGDPFQAVLLLTHVRLAELAPVLKTTPEDLLANLKARGYDATSAEQTLDAVAAASGTSAPDLLFAVMPSSR